jgi:hypothetical protein|tara:strand:- start:181 stop:423 length:243 start_codon:yes stop_codon:yes gene_type:complete
LSVTTNDTKLLGNAVGGSGGGRRFVFPHLLLTVFWVLFFVFVLVSGVGSAVDTQVHRGSETATTYGTEKSVGQLGLGVVV